MTRTIALVLTAGVSLAALGVAPAARAMPLAPVAQSAASGIVQVYHRGKPHRSARVTVYPDSYYVPDYSYYYPPARGFGDRSNVQRGNMRGCTVDLGYGRYESCDK